MKSSTVPEFKGVSEVNQVVHGCPKNKKTKNTLNKTMTLNSWKMPPDEPDEPQNHSYCTEYIVLEI